MLDALIVGLTVHLERLRQVSSGCLILMLSLGSVVLLWWTPGCRGMSKNFGQAG